MSSPFWDRSRGESIERMCPQEMGLTCQARMTEHPRSSSLSHGPTLHQPLDTLCSRHSKRCTRTICNWEKNRTTPERRFLPKITEFLWLPDGIVDRQLDPLDLRVVSLYSGVCLNQPSLCMGSRTFKGTMTYYILWYPSYARLIGTPPISLTGIRLSNAKYRSANRDNRTNGRPIRK